MEFRENELSEKSKAELLRTLDVRWISFAITKTRRKSNGTRRMARVNELHSSKFETKSVPAHLDHIHSRIDWFRNVTGEQCQIAGINDIYLFTTLTDSLGNRIALLYSIKSTKTDHDDLLQNTARFSKSLSDLHLCIASFGVSLCVGHDDFGHCSTTSCPTTVIIVIIIIHAGIESSNRQQSFLTKAFDSAFRFYCNGTKRQSTTTMATNLFTQFTE